MIWQGLLTYSHSDVNVIEQNLNSDFNSICDWFEHNKLSIHLSKNKAILFQPYTSSDVLQIERNGHVLENFHCVEYLGCLLDSNLSGESMAKRCLSKINNRLRFLNKYKHCIAIPFRRILCNALIQPLFDYACCSWYPNLKCSLKKNFKQLRIDASGIWILESM